MTSLSTENNEFGDDPYDDTDSDLPDFVSTDNRDAVEDIHAVRPEVVEKVVKTLSADAQRGDGNLQRADINRTYLRKQLSVAECMTVEERLVSAGYKILEYDENEDESHNDLHSRERRYLNETEERNLGRQIQLALRLPSDLNGLDPAYVDRVHREAQRARTTLLVTNSRYVQQIARRMGEHHHLSQEDIEQEGFIGLLHAANLFDPERGFRFKTYATWWIEQRMRRAIADLDRTIRLPVHVVDKMMRIRKAASKLAQNRGRVPSTDELAVATGLEAERLTKLLWLIHVTDCEPADAPQTDEGSLLTSVPDAAETPFDLMVNRQLQQRCREVLSTLQSREEHIVRMRLGLDTDGPYTLEELGQQYNLTRERVRQIEAKALEKLRVPSLRARLTDFLDN
ncbi:sigma-70 family RNA polymerase sigma factor [Burkholderia pseudomallei]|uniref:sigma-70 family RNA polymerase sigma factor n=1 Tax=Burkholderia pseudomallei TaxID=28450 RepID=UPI00040D002C|nr:sigma-70 family RNA polymerase sigma factor [Burkholderia pseudomallei]MBF3754670.1 sigma-70 family RNA polymerase sigma factor [Burkholderia pseudomallei]MBO7797165.1 sigma-70 family RNA polymerase sigma factor [Burkholderia pseudomallei]MBO7815346.1 sigma-70 family RNA polymerase sigma factor [Burkholderia pseudomallei]MVZ84222.1 sigma-70 family RNA polymerase sigma factor [Burkholderia pseudomallei]